MPWNVLSPPVGPLRAARPPISRGWATLAGAAFVLALWVCPTGAGAAGVAGAAGAQDRQEVIRGLLASGDAAHALAEVDQALAAHPRDVSLIFLRGVALMEARRDAEALAHFERMTQEHPALADPWNNIALLQARANRLELARQALEAALRAEPEHRVARLNLGWVHLMLAAQAWQTLADSGPVEPPLAVRLETVRALLSGAAR